MKRRLSASTRQRSRRVFYLHTAATAFVVAAGAFAAVQALPTFVSKSTASKVAIAPGQSSNPSSSQRSSPAAMSLPAPEGGGLSIAVVAYNIPDMTRARSTLPGNQTLMNIDGVAGQYRSETPLAGPVACTGDPADTFSVADYSVAGRQFDWADETSPQHVASLKVTGWPTGTGTVTFQAATTGSLPCAMSGELTTVDVTVPGADESWVVTADLGWSPSYISGSARVGDLIVSASLAASSADAATARSEDLVTLLTAAVEDLRASGLPAARGG